MCARLETMQVDGDGCFLGVVVQFISLVVVNAIKEAASSHERSKNGIELGVGEPPTRPHLACVDFSIKHAIIFVV